MVGRLEGKVAIVTGGAGGLGAAIASRFAEEGAKVVVADVQQALGESFVKTLPGGARYEQLDVRSEANWRKVVASTEAAFGPVTILVNNAGISGLGRIEDLSEETFRAVIDVNQVGVFLGMKCVVASMRGAGGGAIINMSSIAGIRGAPTAVAYSASKFAVRGMTKVAAIEFGAYNIRVNSIHPGVFDTKMIQGADGKPHDVILGQLAKLPVSRVGDPKELAQMVLLLASDEMTIATGAEFILDGGSSAG